MIRTHSQLFEINDTFYSFFIYRRPNVTALCTSFIVHSAFCHLFTMIDRTIGCVSMSYIK